MAAARFQVQILGMTETLRATSGLEADLRREANRELRQAAGACAGGLQARLVAAALGSGVPVAGRVASSIRIKSDRLPSVTIGGTKRVGRHGAPAARLVWGSEHGPAAGGRNRFGVARKTSGYWIAPTVARFKESSAVAIYTRAVYSILHRWRLV